MRRDRSLTTFLTLVLLAGCSSASSPSGPAGSVAGHWRGTGYTAQAVEVTLDFQLLENGSSVTGDATLTQIGAGDTLSYSPTVSGTLSGSQVTLTLSESGFVPATYAGPLVGDSVVNGSLTGSGFSGETVPVQRQAH